jgi:hypothetical protein
MKITKKSNAFIAFLLLATTFNGYSMEQPSRNNLGWAAIVGGVLLGAVAIKMLWQSQPGEPFPLENLPPEMSEKIIQLVSLNTATTSLEEAAFTINSLAQVNKELNELINDPKFCLKIIKSLAKKFNCSDQEAAKALKTKEAKRRLGLQEHLRLVVSVLVIQLEIGDIENNIKAFIEAGVDLNFTYRTDSGRTLLIMAAMYNNCPMIQMLLKNGAHINKANLRGHTALMVAVYVNNTDAVQCLLNTPNIAINQQDNTGWTALMMAIAKKNKSIIKQLLNAGADAERADFNGITPLQTAQQFGNQEIIDLIQDAIDKKHKRESL